MGDYWKVIASSFDDETAEIYGDFSTSVPEASFYRTLQCERDAVILKQQFQRSRGHFTFVYARYCASGSNDVEKWPEFLYTDGKQELAADMKRAWIIFVATGLNTTEPDTFLLSSALNTFVGGVEEGVMSKSGGNTSTSSGKRKRDSLVEARKDFQDVSKKIDENMGKVQELACQVCGKRHQSRCQYDRSERRRGRPVA